MASEEPSCSICGACFCVPSDRLLLSYLDISSQYKPIVDDDVLWLSHFRLLGRNRSVPQAPSENAQGDEIADPPTIYFLSGPGRVRRSRAEFLRGSIIGTPVGGNWRKIKGEGEAEVLNMSLNVLYDFLTHRNRVERVLVMHEDCYDIILPRAMDYTQKENRLPIRSPKQSLYVMHSKLVVSGNMLVKNRCGAEEPSLWWHAGVTADRTWRTWLQARRVCPCPKSKDVV